MSASDLFKVQKVENVMMLDKYNLKHTLGTFYLTETHFIFMESNGKKKIWVLNTHVGSIEKLPLLTSGSPLHIKCKHFFVVTFVIPKERDCHEVYLTLQRLSSPSKSENLYCFSYKGSNDGLSLEAGWNFFNIRDEFQRQGVPNEDWAISYLNVNYELCETYPKYIYVPSSCNNKVLMGSAKFRSKGRLPVLTYLYSNKASICRCSQPLSGFNARCLKDEEMLYNLLCTNPKSKYLYVVDTRPKINAIANRAAGKGYENENFYDNIKFQFFGIENIHVMRSSLNKLLELQKCTNMSAFLSGLENSGWLKHIRTILETSWFIAQNIAKGISVVVHCSDGWDRTAQVCALAALMLDPYYRTIHGFQVLIEKDWLSFGHKFNDRCGNVLSDLKEVAPVFTQFIDATYQLYKQFPYMFQFNEQYLILLHDHVHSCQHGTFIGNCEKERLSLNLPDKTYSFWGLVAKHINEFINPLYSCKVYKDDQSQILEPKLYPQSIILWRNLYYRFENGVHPRETYENYIQTTLTHLTSLEEHIRTLSKKFSSVLSMDSPNKVEVVSSNKYKFDTDRLKKYLQGKLTSNEENINDKFNIAGLINELNAIALDWNSSRNIVECKCGTNFDAFNKQYHCWSCGNILCHRCLNISTVGFLIERAIPVCKFCLQNLSSSLPNSP